MSSILNPLERDILNAFFALRKSEAFVLTGGAALAEFYFQHRLSNDLDLFTLDEDAFDEVGQNTRALAHTVGAEEKPIRSLVTLHQVMYARGTEEVKVDFVRDSGPIFGEPMQKDNVRVDALENIGANKLLALFGRAAFRDYIDLYFILRESSLTFNRLLFLAKQKDPGLQEFYLANWIRQQTPRLQSPPVLLKPIDLDEVKQYFLKLSEDLVAGLNPDK